MNVRIENIHSGQSPANYVSFLNHPPKSRGRSDRDSVHSIASIRSFVSNMNSFWSSLGIGETNTAKTERAKAQLCADTKYLYSSFTKIPCLRLSPDHRARLIDGYEEFPFDTAVPLWTFKNLSALEICDLDFRLFFGWDKLADQLRSLSLRRSGVGDPLDLIVHIVLDDMDKRRRRSSKPQSSPSPLWPASPAVRQAEPSRMSFASGTPESTRIGASVSPKLGSHVRADSDILVARSSRNRSASPTRPTSARHGSFYRHAKSGSEAMRRSGSRSSSSSSHSLVPRARSRSSTNLLSMGILPASKWRFLRHLSLADNSLTSLTTAGLAPLANTLHSLDLSSNLFSEIPDCLATLTALRALNLSSCMIESLHSLARNPLPAISALNLRSNRLVSIAGIERLFSLERLDIRENRISDPTEMARLTGLPEMWEIYVAGNPLTKLHGNYRTTIFNLFREAPGYTEDILIDSSGPGYAERRRLRERTSEAVAIPMLKPPPAVQTHVERDDGKVSRVPNNVTSRIIINGRPIPHTTQSEAVVGSGRRKRTSKRRIVDLSVDESPDPKPKRLSVECLREMSTVVTPELSNSNASSVNQQLPMIAQQTLLTSACDDPFFSKDHLMADAVVTPPQTPPAPIDLPSQEATLAEELENLKLSDNAESYRQKVEALKEQFGSSWLRVLSESGWDIHAGPIEDRSRLTQPGTTPVQPASQGIVSSGRTLG